MEPKMIFIENAALETLPVSPFGLGGPSGKAVGDLIRERAEKAGLDPTKHRPTLIRERNDGMGYEVVFETADEPTNS